ncbi:unnamed protein product [Mytilus edulis]|uniref:Uncharacterized protein n=1 Tax=Mytilus edulis TaxID=6550 RepID=A0A8S3RAJ9_MYTED|nr:unnamed protein product [Mytilus edulis]
MLPLLLVLIIETTNISALSLGAGFCKKKNKNSIWFIECCEGYKFNQINQTCDECPEGRRGNNCQDDCDDNFFGLRCKGRCNCKQNETCNKVHGCIIIENNIEARINLIAAEESTTTLKDVLTVPTEDMTDILQGDDGGDPVNSIIIAVLLAGLVIIVLVIIWKEREKICRQITNLQVSSVHERNKRRHANVDDENAYSEIWSDQ